jgi:hypothetical protein
MYDYDLVLPGIAVAGYVKEGDRVQALQVVDGEPRPPLAWYEVERIDDDPDGEGRLILWSACASPAPVCGNVSRRRRGFRVGVFRPML